MEKPKNNQNKITAGLFAVYLFALTWIIVFKMQFSFQGLPDFRKINLIPFAGSANVNNQIDFNEIVYNVLAFIPFGIYISMLKPNWSFLKKIAVISGVSLLFEVLQFIFAIGASDITDLIGNTLGGIIGVGVYIVFCKLFSTKTNKILNILTSLGVIFLVALVLVLISGVIRFKF
ncbi:VanZ family protein [Priestia megaterium]|uniref:VanZ family protein n=1 Tax=Priestia megaterium TaxID=1404 RepID=UPI0026E39EE2|nr:VanZ family protein [Priestia megaterium]MDO6851915.1 VanZ family protein [Priestia megaterium]